MKLITTDERLHALIPNLIPSAKGEPPFVQRLVGFLELAEIWVKNTFTSVTTFDSICALEEGEPLREAVSLLVLAEAVHKGIPSLDLVATPNGFGVVSSSNIAPASKPRVDRLIASMLANRDEAISIVLDKLPDFPGWLGTEQADFFAATLFPDLGIADEISDNSESKWDRYVRLRPQIIDAETALANEWLSPELMADLRRKNIAGTLSHMEKMLAASIRVHVVQFIKNGQFFPARLSDLVDFIRKHPGDFPLWHTSATAELFSPPVFRNEKNSGGYFF